MFYRIAKKKHNNNMLKPRYMVVSAVNRAQDVGDLSSFREMLSDPVLAAESDHFVAVELYR